MTAGVFNTRQFDQAGGLHTPGFFSHPLGTTGFEAGKAKAAVRSAVAGIAAPDGDAQPMLFEIFRIDDGRFAEM